MSKINIYSLIYFFISHIVVFSQNEDSLKITKLPAITIEANRLKNDINRLKPVETVSIYSGKKNEVILLNNLDANISDKIARQIFAKVPGVIVYDMEGSNQVNISTRGLDPHRAWEINMRKDGVIINSDLYGYPASHYSIPYESIERIEFVRGTFSLQYGQQFGGMLNYVTKQGDTSKLFSIESHQTVGSYSSISSYNAVGGKYKKIRYYVYYAKRNRDGYRKYESTDYDAQGVKIDVEVNKKMSVGLDWVRSNYIFRPPGPLNDSMFKSDPRQATRIRNYYSPTIQIPSFTFFYNYSENFRVQYISSVILGDRKSVLFDRPSTIKDTINTNTMQYNNRQVDIDRFKSFTNELRLLQNYTLANSKHTLLFGIQVLNNHMHRTQQGKGTTGINYDLTLVSPSWGRNLHYKTRNYSFFVENSFNILKNLTLNVGTRFELGESNITGKIVYYPDEKVPVTIKRNYPLLGSGFSYKIAKDIEFYGSFSQAYRPMLLKDLVPSSIYEKVDPNITDAKGHNAEFGVRNSYLKNFKFDITAFLLQYDKRFGTIVKTDTAGNFYTLRTNVGNSVTKGIEAFIQANIILHNKNQIILFTSTAFQDGRYTSGEIKSGNTNVDLKGKKIEGVPNLISRNGLTFQANRYSVTFLISHTVESYADPLNTTMPNLNGTIGLVPSYTLLDINFSFKLKENINLRANLNNITNKQYFTKRPVFYPGPGVWPSDGRNWSVSLSIKI